MSEITIQDNQIIVNPGTDIISSMSDRFKSELRSLIEKHSCDLTIDFSDVEIIDSIGIGVIVATYNTLHKIENKLKCINLNDNIYTHFRFLRLDRHILIEKK